MGAEVEAAASCRRHWAGAGGWRGPAPGREAQAREPGEARAGIHPVSCRGGRQAVPAARKTPFRTARDSASAHPAPPMAHFRLETGSRPGGRPPPSVLRMDSCVTCAVRPGMSRHVAVARGEWPANHAPKLLQHVRRGRRRRRFPSHKQRCLRANRLVIQRPEVRMRLEWMGW